MYKNVMKKIISFAAGAAMIFTLPTTPIICGSDAVVNWAISGDTLTVSKNTGELPSITTIKDYTASTDAPWNSGTDKYTSLTVSSGITAIGDYAFAECDNNKDLSKVTLGDTVTSIGSNAFNGDTNVTAITIPASVTSIGADAFKNTGITDVTIMGYNTTITGLADSGLIKDGTTFYIHCDTSSSNTIRTQLSAAITASGTTAKISDTEFSCPGVFYNSTTKTGYTTMKCGTCLKTYNTPNHYTVSFISGGGTGTMKDESFVYDTAKALTSNDFTRTGYVFSGWTTDSASTTATYSNKETVNNLSSTANGVVKLYAVWTPMTNTLTFDGGTKGAANSASSDYTKTLTGNTSVSIASMASKYTSSNKYYTFSGWNTKEDGTGVAFLGTKTDLTIDQLTDRLVKETGSTEYSHAANYYNAVDLTNLTDGTSTSTLYAQWVEKGEYDIVFKSNGGTGSMDTVTYSTSTATALPENTFINGNSAFTGWNTKADGTGTAITDKASVTASSYGATVGNGDSVTLYAQWKAPTTSKVTFTWDDDNNRDGKRPTSVSLTLKGTNGKSTTVSTSSSETYTFDNLPTVYTSSGVQKTITYSLSVTAIAGYTTTITSGSDGSYNVKLSHTSETKTVNVTFKWNDNNNQDGKRPKNIKTMLTGSDGTVYSTNATISSDNASTSFSNVYKYANKAEITYKVSVDAVEGYTITTSGSGDSFSVTGEHKPETTAVSVTTKWDDNNNKAEKRPTLVTIKLTGSNSKVYGGDLKEANNFTYKFEDLPKYVGGTAVVYKLTQASIDGYKTTVTQSGDDFVVTNKIYTSLLKNTTVTNKTAVSDNASTATSIDKNNLKDISVSIIWNDGDADYIRPANVSIALVDSNGKMYKHTLSKDTSYSYIYSKMPIKNVNAENTDNDELTYKIKQETIDGYTTHIYQDKDNPYKFTIENFRATQGDKESDEFSIPDTASSESSINDADASQSDSTGSDTIGTLPSTQIPFPILAGILAAGAVSIILTIVVNKPKK